MQMATPPKDAYAVLGVDPAADDASIAAAYRMLARRYHPDIAGEPATRRMSRINAAWDRLRDPEKRAAYDAELAEIDPARAAMARSRPRRHHAAPPKPEPPGPGSTTAWTRPTRATSAPSSAMGRAAPGDRQAGRRGAS